MLPGWQQKLTHSQLLRGSRRISDLITFLLQVTFIFFMTSEENKSKKIGRRIRMERMAKLIKQETLGKKVSLSKSEISRIENGQRELRISKLYEIADAIGISASKLFEDD